MKPATLIPLAALTAALAGCTIGGSSSASAENDRLRKEVAELKTRITELEQRNAELEAKLAAAEGGLSPEALAALPVCAKIEIDPLSRVERGESPRLTVYLKPLDGRGRFVQIVGELSIHLRGVTTTETDIGSGAASTPGPVVPIADTTLRSTELREAYRAGFMGTHYVVHLPVDAAALPPADSSIRLEIHATFTDAVTGQRHEAVYTLPKR